MASKLELSWQELRDMLHKAGRIIPNSSGKPTEEIREITLMKPKVVRIYLERR